MTQEIKDDHDWKEAFKYANPSAPEVVDRDVDTSSFEIGDVQEIFGMSEGDNDGPPWLMIGQLKDGRYFYLSAWCDYTGWG